MNPCADPEILRESWSNILQAFLRERPFEEGDYYGPGFFLRTPEPGFFYFLRGTVLEFFISQDHAYKNKAKWYII